MAGQLKEVRNRIKSVQSTQQITKAMKMVSAAKLRRAQDAIIQMRPYARKLQEMLSNIVSNTQVESGDSLAGARPVEKVLIIVITSDRGLAGAYNTNVIKMAKQTINEKYNSQRAKGNVTIWSIGKKGFEHFSKNNYKVDGTFRDIFLNLSFGTVQQAAEAAVKGFRNKEFDAVEIVYSEFKNAATQRFVSEQFLPIPKAAVKINKTGKEVKADFIFDPNIEELIAELMPKILNTQLFKAVLDANASEHGARMTAMDKASENANEILRNLRISYNRARQAAITTELTEIVSGAAALKG
ncbi:MAG TPA: ATP synthase F1 subunit gamma [Flavisolibacter sp.]|nr:ATP synthase F1 subunit gamma [Flavisolibacter sp.]